MPEILTKLVSDPVNIGLVVGVLALLFLGKEAPGMSVLSWIKSKIFSGAPKPKDDHGDNCQRALLCIMEHALIAGDTELLKKLNDLVEPVNKLHADMKGS
jgi:hypothetical protein